MPETSKQTIDQIKQEIRRRARHDYAPLPYEALFRHEAQLAYRHDILKLAVVPPSNSWKDRIRVFCKKVFALGLRWILMRQVEFNRVAVDHFREFSEALTLLDERLSETTMRLSALRRRVQAMDRRASFDPVPDPDNPRMSVEANEHTLEATSNQMDHRLKGMEVQLDAVRRQIAHVSRRSKEPDSLLNFDYLHFQNTFRGTRDEIKARQEVYRSDFQNAGPVVDLGCGRGEFVEMLSEAGIPVTGVDADAAMVDFCRELGLPVVEEDAVKYLEKLQDNVLGGIFSSQAVEHMRPADLLQFLEGCRAKLRVGGVLVIETVNPLCVGVLCNFWLDPTHERPIHPRLLHHLLETMGFRELEMVFSSPTHALPPVVRTIDWSDGDVIHYQDYAVVARK